MGKVLIPEERKYDDTLQVKVSLPRDYFWDNSSDYGRRGIVFRPINYLTLKPVDDYNIGLPGVTSYSISPTSYCPECGINAYYDRYPDIGQMRFGLSYRPAPVPGRPEELWKRNYLKPNVSGRDFYIGCVPPIGPGSIIEPKTCGMHILLHPKEMNGRPSGIEVNASVPASKIEDWVLIEAAIRKLLEPNIEWVEVRDDERK